MISRRNLFKRIAGVGVMAVAAPLLAKTEISDDAVYWLDETGAVYKAAGHEAGWPGIKAWWNEACKAGTADPDIG